MAVFLQLWRHRRYLLLGTGLLLLGELAAGPAPRPQLYLHLLAGLTALGWVALFAPGLRYVSISVLIALIPVRLWLDPLADALAALAPVSHPAWVWAGLIAATLLASRLVALTAVPLDRLALRHPWFAEAVSVIARPRREVWRALCLGESCAHWDPRIRSVLQDLRFPSRFIVFLDRHPGRLVVRELEREEGVFQEVETEADPNFCHGLAPIISVLLEEVPRGTRVTIAMELHHASLLRLGRLFLDADLTWYLRVFTRAMTHRPRRPLLPAPRIARLSGSQRRPAAIHG
ncbi:MAG: hypothetical protein D6754_17575 [Alphaproteobacteria bacterium]|nr:MAG: hypothetical protein D6754_17575 [Alphaproteobacteria bacterium]